MDDPVADALAIAQELPARAVAALFERYGKPLAVELPAFAPGDPHAEWLLDEPSSADLSHPDARGGASARVRALQFRMPMDVIGNDWFVLEVAGREPLAMPGPLFAAAVAALSRAAGEE